jgi:hypothetical protein
VLTRNLWHKSSQMELPERGVAVGWEVELDIDLLLMREDRAAAHEGS